MSIEILSQQRVIGITKEGGLGAGKVVLERRADGSVYRVDIEYASVVVCGQDDSLSFQRSLGGQFDDLLLAGISERSRRLWEEIQSKTFKFEMTNVGALLPKEKEVRLDAE